MAINLNDLAGALTGAQEQPAAPRASRDQYGTIALDAHGTPTVMLDGGEDYAPCTCMVGVHHGDRVLAHVVNHKIVVFANITAPTTDDAQALVAIDRADAAAEAADAAGIAAASAQGSADAAASAASIADGKAAQAIADAATAAQAAEAVEGLAQQASQDAAAASTAASNAITAANKATYALSDVEKVVGTVNWIAEHGSYELTQDTAIVPGKVYYTRTGTAPDYTYEVVANPEASGLATYYELELDESVQNFLASHLWLGNYGLNLSVDSANGYRIHQGTVDGTKAVGTYILDPDGEQVLALTASGEVIGKPYVQGATDNESHMELDYHSMKMVDKEGAEYLHISDLRDRSGTAEVIEQFYADGSSDEFEVSFSVYEPEYVLVNNAEATFSYSGQTFTVSPTPARDALVEIAYLSASKSLKAYTLGERHSGSKVGPFSFAVGNQVTSSGSHSYAEGNQVYATGDYSHAEGKQSQAFGSIDHVEGDGAHAESKVYTQANYSLPDEVYTTSDIHGSAAHAEGYRTHAIAHAAHAEGHGTIARKAFSHAAGYKTQANGACSTATGNRTIATGKDQVVIGRANIPDTNGDYALIIGNGTAEDARSNAMAVRWNGLTDVAGETAYPLFVYSTAPDEADLPVTPCFVLATDDYGLWYYDGN